jgi:hypothetical protein
MARRKSKGFSIRKPRLRLTLKGLRVSPPSVRIGGRTGVNISKRGVSASVHGRRGSFNSKRGCSVPLGILPILLVVGLALL